jgi:hypothetical protein
MDRRLISEKHRGLSAKFAKLDRGLISKKQWGFFAKWRGISAEIFFSTDKVMERVHASVDQPVALSPQRGRGRGAAVRSPELG